MSRPMSYNIFVSEVFRGRLVICVICFLTSRYQFIEKLPSSGGTNIGIWPRAAAYSPWTGYSFLPQLDIKLRRSPQWRYHDVSICPVLAVFVSPVLTLFISSSTGSTQIWVLTSFKAPVLKKTKAISVLSTEYWTDTSWVGVTPSRQASRAAMFKLLETSCFRYSCLNRAASSS